MKRFTLLLTALFLSWGMISQNVFMVEHFDYPANTPLQSNGWTAHSAGTTNPIQVEAPGLAWSQTPYLGSGIGNAAAVNNTGSDENLALSDLQLDSGAVYTSFLARMNGAVTTTGVFFHLGQYSNTSTPDPSNISSAFRARLHMLPGTTADKYKLGLTFNQASASGSDITTAEFDTGTTYLYVIKYEFFPGPNNDSVSLYVFEDGDIIDLEPSTPVLGPFGGTQNDLAFLQLVALRQFNANQNTTIDGIIVQDTWDMVPNFIAAEPLIPANNTMLQVTGPIATPVTISWTAAQNIGTPITYEWQLAARAAGNFSTPLLALPGDNSGIDTTLSLTIGAIDAA
ncbi:MAG: hypothetical protein LAT76_00180, partial [Schleiferiaceae bacterium]|nr:hypothetical protein [Schleiferiaceae bacterium]